jgi:flavin reductase (DIM6/NTAB) family NADH-FMN oxidoreductase RutF
MDAPVTAQEPQMEPSAVALALKQGLRSLAKAVVVITCRDGRVRYAMTATAVSELSMDPPSLLICVNKTASLHSPLTAGADFCVNILSAEQIDIAHQCSGRVKGEARFASGSWDDSHLGAPMLKDAQASFVCRNASKMEYGTHSIFIGEVVAVVNRDEIDTLVYVNGEYGRVGPL